MAVLERLAGDYTRMAPLMGRLGCTATWRANFSSTTFSGSVAITTVPKSGTWLFLLCWGGAWMRAEKQQFNMLLEAFGPWQGC
jgi:hypothetical protein